MIIMQMVNTRSLSVSAATLPKPTWNVQEGCIKFNPRIPLHPQVSLTEVMQVIVKYSAVTYIDFFEGPLINSGAFVSLDQT